jgi:hypothetical protein
MCPYVLARLSRSSALASKATGYPLAYTAAKVRSYIRNCSVRLTAGLDRSWLYTSRASKCRYQDYHS